MDVGMTMGFSTNWSSSGQVALSLWFKGFCLGINSLNPALRPNLRANSDNSLCHVIDSCKILGSTLELGPMKIKPTLVGFSEE